MEKETGVNGTMPTQASSTTEIKVYRRRIWMQILFSFESMLCGIMFPIYASMSNLNACYYGVGYEAIDWTALIFMIVYIVLVLPVSYTITRIDLRWTVICVAVANTVASAIQFATLSRSSFEFVMVTAFFSSISNVLVLGIPPFLAAKWFPSNELSRSCAFGVFGNQLGVALGFIIPPLMVSSDCSQIDLISDGKRNLAYFLTTSNIVTLLLIIFTFQNAPKTPPSHAQAQKKEISPEPYTKTVLGLIKNIDFILVFVMYGLMVGSYFALSTTLNNLILRFFPNREVEVGWMGLLFILAGLLGSIIAGYILDRTHRFKEVSMGICIASLLSFVLFSGVLFLQNLLVQFTAIIVFGFFLTSFLPIGFEYGIEVTYPASESVCACVLNTSTQIFGIILTEIVSKILNSKGAIYSNAALCVTLFLCCIISSFITRDYKRSKKNIQEKTSVPP